MSVHQALLRHFWNERRCADSEDSPYTSENLRLAAEYYGILNVKEAEDYFFHYGNRKSEAAGDLDTLAREIEEAIGVKAFRGTLEFEDFILVENYHL